MAEAVLLLQGPIGSFFKRLASDLKSSGCKVYKINFNGGDSLFYRDKNTLDYSGSLPDWGTWLERRVVQLSIKRIYLFGDCRAYHQIALSIGQTLGIKVFVFECGYIRPDFITLEEGGVNGFSKLSKDPRAYSGLLASPPRRGHALKGEFLRSALLAMAYYIASSWIQKRFPHYQHHRPLNVFHEGALWIKSSVNKIRSMLSDNNHKDLLRENSSSPFFFVPLQVHNDTQVVQHSPYRDVSDFIGTVTKSFAQHAPKDARLVVKHHPHDRAYRNYSALLQELAEQYGLTDRLIYIHDLSLPDLLKHARGVITINSTVGLSALHHRTPVITMGEAIYDMEGLCFQGKLESFWRHPGEVDWALFYRFRAFLLRKNQIEGSLYQKLPKTTGLSGLRWPEALRKEHLNSQQAPNHRLGDTYSQEGSTMTPLPKQ